MGSNKQNLSDLFGSEEAPKSDTSKNKIMLPALLFKAQLEAHITHLQQPDRTLATHKALQKFYEDIDDPMDTFIETCFGVHGVQQICVEKACVINNPIQYFKDLYDTIEKLRPMYKEQFLQNQIDEVQQLIAHTLYRLENIKS